MTKYRKTYFENLVSRIQDKSLKVKYLFATELTKQKIIENKDWEAIKRFEQYEKYPNLSLRHAPVYSVIASAIGSHDFMFGMASPYTQDQVGIVHLSSFNTQAVKETYDRIFANAKEPYELIQEIKPLKKSE